MTPIVWTHRAMIVEAADAPSARAMAEAASGPAGADMWTTGLSATGMAPATHYISSGQIDKAFADLMPLTTFDEDGVPSTTPGQYAAIAAATGVPVAQVQALLERCDVTEQDPFVAMARLGLEFVQEEVE